MSVIAHDALGAIGIPTMCSEPLKVGSLPF